MQMSPTAVIRMTAAGTTIIMTRGLDKIISEAKKTGQRKETETQIDQM